jgi:transcriptional regulator with GAF, ATPase, and Fis domain
MTDPTKKKIDFIGESPAIRRVAELVEKVADNDSTVLLCGESGTGKEVIAKTIHYQSLRADKPFIPINCGAIPEALLESELFGHEKGAFTGANNIRMGRFELANNGTLFLDEIGEMPYPLQVKLLRVIQELEFERIGGTRSIRVDVRIIAATNIDLERAVLEKRFRNDLFYRLNVIPVTLPPLRQRKEDIPLLVAHFLERFNQKKQKKVIGFSSEAMALLLAYPWPGNVRELENIVERTVVLKDEGEVTPDDLPEKVKGVCELAPIGGSIAGFLSPAEGGLLGTPTPAPPPTTTPVIASSIPLPGAPAASASFPWAQEGFEIPDHGIPFMAWIEALEDELIQKALKKSNGVKSQAAQLLHLNRTTLVEKLKRKKGATTPARPLSPLEDGAAPGNSVSP